MGAVKKSRRVGIMGGDSREKEVEGDNEESHALISDHSENDL